MKRTALPSLDLIDVRRRLVAIRSSHSDNRQITIMINRLIGRFAHLGEPENEKQEGHLRRIITATIEKAEQIASRTSWTPNDDQLLRKMIEDKLTADEIATRFGRPISSIKTRGYALGLPFKRLNSRIPKGGHRMSNDADSNA